MNKLVKYVERKNTDCCKWDNLTPNFGEEDLQAMWVADMDFEVAPCIKESLQDYLSTGVFGYYNVPDTYDQSFINWENTFHHYPVEKDWIRFSPGVVPAINWLLQICTQPGDAVITQTPVYYPFLNAVQNNNRTLITCDLINTNGYYTIDFDAFEQKIITHQVKLFILCSPHNPVGRVWTKEELTELLTICKKHHVFVIADEIHQDIILCNRPQYTAATLGDYDDMLVTLTAATKTFNLAACQNSFVIIPCSELREKFDAFVLSLRISGGNAFGYIATQAAYTAGRPWFEEVLTLLKENEQFVRSTLLKQLPLIEISPLEGTYLLWINFSHYLHGEQLKTFMQKQCGLAFDYGDWFGDAQFDGFIRMNLATSHDMVAKAVTIIIEELHTR